MYSGMHVYVQVELSVCLFIPFLININFFLCVFLNCVFRLSGLVPIIFLFFDFRGNYRCLDEEGAYR